MIRSDKKGLLYYKIIYRNLLKLFEMKLDLKIYLKSSLVIRKLDPKYFLNHTCENGKTKLIGSTASSISNLITE